MREGSGRDTWWTANWPGWARRLGGHIRVSMGGVTFGISNKWSSWVAEGFGDGWSDLGSGRCISLMAIEVKRMRSKRCLWFQESKKTSLLNFPLIAIIGPFSKLLCFGSKLVCKFPDWMQIPSYLEIDPRFCFSILLPLHLSCTLHRACRWLLLCGGVVIKYSLNNSTVSLRPDRHVECILLF